MNEIKHPCFNTDEPCEFEVMYNQTVAERVRLRKINAELVAALELIANSACDHGPGFCARDSARASLAKAQAE